MKSKTILDVCCERNDMTCPYCNGTGKIYVEPRSSYGYRCTDCGGTGQVPDDYEDNWGDDDNSEFDRDEEPNEERD